MAYYILTDPINFTSRFLYESEVSGSIQCTILPSQVTKKASNALISATLASVMLVSPAMASVDFANVKNGAKVSSPVHLDFVVTGASILSL